MGEIVVTVTVNHNGRTIALTRSALTSSELYVVQETEKCVLKTGQEVSRMVCSVFGDVRDSHTAPDYALVRYLPTGSSGEAVERVGKR